MGGDGGGGGDESKAASLLETPSVALARCSSPSKDPTASARIAVVVVYCRLILGFAAR